MGRRKTLTDAGIAKLEVRAKSYSVPDPELPGHYVRVWPSGSKSFAAAARAPHGKQIWHSIGLTSVHRLTEARALAREAIKAIREGRDRAAPQSFQAVTEQWLQRHVEAKGLRSAVETRRYLNRDILPAWGGRDFTSIRRGDIVRLLDTVEDKVGPVAADNVLKRVSAICTWYASRHEDYASPIVKGMRRSSTAERARSRILTDDELRAVWQQAEANGTFGAFLRLLLLTGQRREKVAAMRWQDISIDGTWRIPTEAREKGNANELKLPAVAREIIQARTRFVGNPFVFAGRGGSHFSGYSKSKVAFDAKTPLPQWRLHDLRRTARSLMSRAGVRPDIAERVLGHSIRGVEGTYDRHAYVDEKADALRRLAGVIENVVLGAADKVVPIGKRA